MKIEISEGIEVPSLGRKSAKRVQIIHAMRTMRSDESMLVTIPNRTPRDVQVYCRQIANQVNINITTRAEETGCRIWVRFKDEKCQ